MKLREDSYRFHLAQRIWPEYKNQPVDTQVYLANDILGASAFLPFAVLSLIWMIQAGNQAQFLRQPGLIVILVMLYLAFNQVGFFWIMEIAPGRFADFETSLDEFMLWTSLLLLGPTGIWTWLVFLLIKRGHSIWQARTSPDRWNWTRNLVLEITCVALGMLLALPVYQSLGGRFPLSALSWHTIAPTLAAMLVYSSTSIVPLGLYFLSTVIKPNRQAVLFLLVPSLIPALVNPVAILAASLYATLGTGAFLFLMGILLLGSLLANRLSKASERSRRQARQLSALEALGRALVGAPADVSILPALLEQHVASMSLSSRIEIRLFPNNILLHTPPGSPEVDPTVWDFLRQSPQPLSKPEDQPLPWNNQALPEALLLVPILSDPERRLLGGIYVSMRSAARVTIPDRPDEMLPAFQNLAALIASAVHQAETYKQALDHQAMVKEIELAAQIQADLLPAALPKLDGWQISGALNSARQTSGDFFDTVELPNGRWGLLVADVADKGFGAALFMALSRTLLRTYILAQESPGAALVSTNHRILEDSRSDQFVTVFLGVLDPASGQLAWASAGHNPALLLRPNGETLRLEPNGMALGVLPEATWKSERLQFQPGDVLVIYTDGIIDAINPAGEFFDEERLLHTVQQARAASPRAICDALLEAVNAHANGAPQTDDITLLVIKRL